MFRLHRLGNLPHLGRGGGQAAEHKKNHPSLPGIPLAAVGRGKVTVLSIILGLRSRAYRLGGSGC